MKLFECKKIVKCVSLLAVAFLSAYISGCASDSRNEKYVPWNMETSTPIAEPNISDVRTQITKDSNYWSFLYLFGVYEVNRKYAGFDILYFIDFTKQYDINNVAYENDGSFWDFIPSRSKRLKNMTLGEISMKSHSDVMLSPMYKIESIDYIFYQKADCKTSCYAGKLRGFKVRGQGYKDAYIPNDKAPETPFLVKPSTF